MRKNLFKVLNYIRYTIKTNWLIIFLIIIAFVIQLLSLRELGCDYSLNSDDASYIASGITFMKTGQITMHGVLSAQIMPGMTFLIAIFALVFGTGLKFLFALKIFWMLMGVLTIIIIYKTLRLYVNNYIACIPCLFFLTADYIWMNNLILTETPYILLFSLLVYHSLRLSIKTNTKDFAFIVIFYVMSVFIRPNIGIFPIGLIVLLLLKKYDLKLLIKQCLIAGIALILFLIPWIYRNYKLFDKFIPLTYGTGNPLLLGTYQGYGYPLDEELDYVKNVDDKLPKKMKYYLNNKTDKEYLTRYYLLEYDGLKAKYRMREWWNKNKTSMIKSYIIEKPKILFYNAFYWDEIFNINEKFILFIRMIEIILFIISILIIIIEKSKIKELLFLLLTYVLQIAIYSYTFAFSRYAVSMFFIRYIIIGIGLGMLVKKILKRRSKNENIDDNSSV